MTNFFDVFSLQFAIVYYDTFIYMYALLLTYYT